MENIHVQEIHMGQTRTAKTHLPKFSVFHGFLKKNQHTFIPIALKQAKRVNGQNHFAVIELAIQEGSTCPANSCQEKSRLRGRYNEEQGRKNCVILKEETNAKPGGRKEHHL